MMHTASYTTSAASAKLVTGAGAVLAVHLAAGSDAATAILYDNTEASGTVICKLTASAANTADAFCPAVRLPFSTGLYLALTGTAPSCTVCYTP